MDRTENMVNMIRAVRMNRMVIISESSITMPDTGTAVTATANEIVIDEAGMVERMGKRKVAVVGIGGNSMEGTRGRTRAEGLSSSRGKAHREFRDFIV